MTRTEWTSSLPFEAAQQAISKPRAILVVDDHDLVRMGVCALLQANISATSFDVLEAGDLAEALAIYEGSQDAIELVLLDLSLPDTKGLSGLMEFRARYPGARVVVLSEAGSTTICARTSWSAAPRAAGGEEVALFMPGA